MISNESKRVLVVVVAVFIAVVGWLSSYLWLSALGLVLGVIVFFEIKVEKKVSSPKKGPTGVSEVLKGATQLAEFAGKAVKMGLSAEGKKGGSSDLADRLKGGKIVILKGEVKKK